MNTADQQTLALAALIQACYCVDQLARKGQVEDQLCSVLIDSLFVFNPKDGSDIYAQPKALKPGLDLLEQIISQGDNQAYGATIRYALGAIHLQAKLNKSADLMTILRNRLEHIARHRSQDDQSSWHDNCHQLSGVYQDTVSTLAFRLQIMGNANYLKQTSYSEKIRSLLLCAIRAAFLWRQSGGHRWQLIFKRKQILRQIHSLQQRL